VSPLDSNLAVAQLTQAKLGDLKGSERRRQVKELLRLTGLLEQGSVSLNQRATTLAALAVAALGAFGAFATRLSEIHSLGMTIAAAALLTAATVALLAAALFALRSARPGGKWSDNFAAWSRTAIEQPPDRDALAEHLASTIKMQLRRNRDKAELMKHAYRSSTLAVIAAALAVTVVAVDAVVF